MDKSYPSRFMRGELGSSMAGAGSSKTSRFFRYSGAHTTTGLDRVAAPAAHEMSYTARKYSSHTYTSGGQRRGGSQEQERARGSQERLSSGRGPTSDRENSGYSSRRGSSGSDLLHSTSSSSYSSLSSSSTAKAAARSSYGGSPYSRTSSSTSFVSATKPEQTAYRSRHSSDRDGESENKYSRVSSSADPSSRQGGRQDTPESAVRGRGNEATPTHSQPSVSSFITGYATLERRNNRRKKDYLTDRKSVDRVLDTSPSYSSLERRSKYGRTYSCDLPSCRTTPVKDYTKELYSKYSSAGRGNTTSSLASSNTTNSYNNKNYNNTISRSNGYSNNNGVMSKSEKTRALSPTNSEGRGGGQQLERERSPSVRAIYEGLARINQALEKHRTSPFSTLPSTTSTSSTCSSTIPTPPPPPPPLSSTSSCLRRTREAHNMKAALAASGSRSGGCAKTPRTRVNNFAPTAEKMCIEKQMNLMPDIEIPAEARLAQRRAARAEARELRLRELEKQQHEQDNEEEKQFASPSYTDDDDCEDDEYDEEEEPVPRAGLGRAAGRSAGMNCSGQYSRRSSEDSTTDEATLPANVREMRTELKELDEKFRKAMITNAQLDNEKATLTFEVELMKDKYTELEEAHTQLTKEHRKKCTEYEQLKKVSMKLQEEVKILRSMLQERDQLIQEYGLVVMGEEENGDDVDHTEEEDDDVDDLSPRKLSVKKVLVSQEVAELLSKGAARGSLDVRLKKFCEEKNDLEDQVRRLKLELEEERSKSRRRENGLDYEKQKEQSKTVNEYKFRVQKAEAEVATLQANVARLDALSNRYKTQSEELERSEEELKLEKRKLQRELRDAQSRLEELETTNNHLIKRFDKLKNARSNLLKDLSQDPA